MRCCGRSGGILHPELERSSPLRRAIKLPANRRMADSHYLPHLTEHAAQTHDGPLSLIWSTSEMRRRKDLD